MRILYFSRAYSTHDRRFLIKILEAGHEAVFLRLLDDGFTYETRQLPAGIHDAGCLGVDQATPDACLRRMPRFTKILDRFQPDVIHAGPIPTCAFMASLAGARPLIAMSWGSDILLEAQSDELVHWASCHALRQSDLLIVDCDAVRETICGMVAITADRFIQLPWGLDLSNMPKHPPRRRLSENDEIVVLSTRTWSEIYGIETVLEAFARAHRLDSRLRLSLVGDGPLAPRIDALIGSLAIRDVVERPGWVTEDDLDRRFAQADIYVSCTLSDGTSISLLQAMAHGLPVVLSDIAGNREWIVPDTNGWLAPTGDADAFARALVRAARLDDAQRVDIARNNRAVIENRANWNVNARRVQAAYERAATMRRS